MRLERVRTYALANIPLHATALHMSLAKTRMKPSQAALDRAITELRQHGLPVFLDLAFSAGLVSEADGSWIGDEADKTEEKGKA